MRFRAGDEGRHADPHRPAAEETLERGRRPAQRQPRRAQGGAEKASRSTSPGRPNAKTAAAASASPAATITGTGATTTSASLVLNAIVWTRQGRSARRRRADDKPLTVDDCSRITTSRCPTISTTARICRSELDRWNSSCRGAASADAELEPGLRQEIEGRFSSGSQSRIVAHDRALSLAQAGV